MLHGVKTETYLSCPHVTRSPEKDVKIKCKQSPRRYKDPKNSMLKEIGCIHNNNQRPILMFTLIHIAELSFVLSFKCETETQ